MADFITRDRALSNLNNLDASSDENTTIGALITAVSAAIENYCWRTFEVADYDELYPGNDRRELVLRNYPILSVERVAFAPTPVLRVTNTSASNQRATVKVTATGLELIRVASGVATTSTIAFGSQPTLTALATAVTALGNGWSAAVINSPDNLRASADLRALQGAFPGLNVNAELKLHTSELANFVVDAERGCLTHGDGIGFHGGLHYWRVIYSAGFSAIPDEVQEACAEWVAQLFWQTKRDPGLISEAVPGAFARSILRDMPASVKFLLSPYRNWRV
jgi:hypothetical protein